MSKNKLFFLTNKRKFLEERFTSNIKKIQKKNILAELSLEYRALIFPLIK